MPMGWIITGMRTQDRKICVPCDGALRSWDRGCVGWLPQDPEMMLGEWMPRCSSLPSSQAWDNQSSGLLWNLVNGSEGKNCVLSGPLPDNSSSLSCLSFPSTSPPFFLVWCLLLTWSSFLPRCTLCKRRPGWPSPPYTEPCLPQLELCLKR